MLADMAESKAGPGPKLLAWSATVKAIREADSIATRSPI